MRALGSLVLVPVLLASGCSDDAREHEQPPKPAVTTPADRTPPAPQVVASGEGTGLECLEHITTDDFGYWENTLTASAPVQVTRVEAVGHGARIVGGLLVPVVGGTVHSTGVSDWPPTSDRVLRRDVDWDQRSPLVGGRLPVQRAMLPMLHVRAVGGGRLEAVVFHFRGEDGRTGSVRLALGFRFSRTTC